MRHGKLTRDEAVALVGEATVARVEAEPCEPTSRLQTDGDDSVEWSASIHCDNGDCITAYYYLSPEQMQTLADADGDGSAIDWEIEGYEVGGMSHDAVKAYLAGIGRKGGSAKSPAKAAASRANGAKGGRPKSLPFEFRGIVPDSLKYDEELGISYTLADGASVSCPPQGGVWINHAQVSGTVDSPHEEHLVALRAYRRRQHT